MAGQPGPGDAVAAFTELHLLMGQLHDRMERANRVLRMAIHAGDAASPNVQPCMHRLGHVLAILTDMVDTLEPDAPDEPRPAGAAPGSRLTLC